MSYLKVFTIFFLDVFIAGCAGNADKNSIDPVENRAK